MSTNHTPEPWIYKKLKTSVGHCFKIGDEEMANSSCGGICAYDDSTTLNPHPAGQQEANARRIVACVNACAGVPIEILEAGKMVPPEMSYRDLKQQRDELLEALKAISELDARTDSDSGFNEWGESECFHKAQDMAKVAIDKIEGKP